MYHLNPPAEAVPTALPSSTAMKNRRWFSKVPLIALCCLGILGLLLVGTIVLALIPVYLPKRSGERLAVQSSSPFLLVYAVINDESKREIRVKRGYFDQTKTSSTPEEKQKTAAQISYAYNFQSNQAKIVVDNIIFSSSFVLPFHLDYSPQCYSQSCQIGRKGFGPRGRNLNHFSGALSLKTLIYIKMLKRLFLTFQQRSPRRQSRQRVYLQHGLFMSNMSRDVVQSVLSRYIPIIEKKANYNRLNRKLCREVMLTPLKVMKNVILNLQDTTNQNYHREHRRTPSPTRLSPVHQNRPRSSAITYSSSFSDIQHSNPAPTVFTSSNNTNARAMFDQSNNNNRVVKTRDNPQGKYRHIYKVTNK
ncbi:unnamed protein product [Didymodactylos carnosus]|uniref:Uncharacterized protein n=2 Tax=Didymodactylos carnosus TaxID=1234261 RepID=A0A8S2GFV2_9BILA|nr:unnamed protein product [Didymodactylos carnosus]CAF3511867.1 unnamed protein product [Didymodactylos carnosus]